TVPSSLPTPAPGTAPGSGGHGRLFGAAPPATPPPAVVCARGGVPVGTTRPEPVTRDRAGTYECRATNALGTRSQRVTVRVEYEPTLSEGGCPSHRVWVEGQRRDPSWCRAHGDPPPSTRCHRDNGATNPPHGATNLRHGATTPHNGTRDTPRGGTRDAPRGGPARAPRGGRVVSRADAGRYLCRATNKHGVATRSVLVTVEYEPSIPEPGCPERRLWLEGTPAQLGCAATGNPPPRVTCAKVGDSRDHPPVTAEGVGDTWGHPLVTPNVTRTELGDTRDPPWVPPNVTWTKPGDTQDPPVSPSATWTKAGGPRDPSLDPPRVPPTVTRAHAGTYQCRATNAHGSATRNVTVAVEYGPAAVTLRALPSANVTRGSSFSLDCGAEGVPAPTFAWALPPAPNLRLGPDNRSVTVTGATAANRGLYTCTATNRHGRGAGSVLVSVD
ncbi:intercellular adhesion molecule 5-like, partial [Corapipo altera]|uniref:intercellular adhesion molecule 5-like n=1 Tax=Corapipo altera TaxID=415028 RepID=UPI000FD68CE7